MRATCPRCGSELQLTEDDRVPLALCAGCRGLWLSVPALIARLGGDPADPVGRLLQALMAAPAVPHGADPAGGNGLCPGCRCVLPTKRVGGVYLEHCGTCHGIFLDRGELLALAARLPAPHPDHTLSSGVSPEVAELFTLLVNPWWD